MLNILKYEDLSVNSVTSEDPLENLVTRYKNHPDIRAILDNPKYVIFVENSFQEGHRKGNFKPKCSKSISRF